MEHFKIARWGNSYAVRIPSRLVKELGLKEGDEFPGAYFSRGAALAARLEAERERNRIAPEEADAAIRQARKRFPRHLKPEDWKIDRGDPNMRG